VEVEDSSTGAKYMFPCNRWLSKSEDDKQISRELTCSNLPSPKVKSKISMLCIVSCSMCFVLFRDSWFGHDMIMGHS